MSFDPLYDYKEKDYFYLDQYVIIHQWEKGALPYKNDTIFIPPRKMIYDKSTNVVKREKTNYIFMSFILNDALKRINYNSDAKEKYKIISDQKLLVKGILTLEKCSGEKIKIKIPVGYPVNIEVIKK